MLSNVVMYLALRHEYMRNKRFEKLLERRRKSRETAQQKLEQLDSEDQQNHHYMNSDGSIDWDQLSKHISEALRGRQQG